MKQLNCYLKVLLLVVIEGHCNLNPPNFKTHKWAHTALTPMCRQLQKTIFSNILLHVTVLWPSTWICSLSSTSPWGCIPGGLSLKVDQQIQRLGAFVNICQPWAMEVRGWIFPIFCLGWITWSTFHILFLKSPTRLSPGFPLIPAYLPLHNRPNWNHFLDKPLAVSFLAQSLYRIPI